MSTLARTPEPELMDDTAQAAAYAGADFAAPHDLCVALFVERYPAAPRAARVVDLGCGPADITVRFARRFPEMHFDGVDGAAAMLAQGATLLTRAGLAGRIQLWQRLLPCIDLPNAPYDIIVSNSLLHHLHDPRVMWQTVKQCGQTGTIVYIMDLFRPASTTAARHLVQHYAGTEPDILQHDFYQSLLAAFTPAEVQAQLTDAQLTQLTIKIVSDRHMIITGRL